MTMTVGHLIRILQVLDEDTEIRIASQPNWPFEYSIAGVTTRSRYDDEEDGMESDSEPGEEDQDPPDIAFIVEGEQLKYGDKKAFDREYRICV
jgi:hypothetical protein